MTKNTGPAWNTKYGPRRVRHDPPTLSEAIAAARDIADEREAQVEIAASLMGVSREQVAAELAKLAPQPKVSSTLAFTTTRTGIQRAVVVERKPSRRIVTADRSAVLRSLNSSPLEFTPRRYRGSACVPAASPGTRVACARHRMTAIR